MGQITIVWYAVLAVLAVVLLAVGLLLKKRALTITGGAVLLGLVGAWIIGLPGFFLAVIPVVWRRKSGSRIEDRGSPAQ